MIEHWGESTCLLAGFAQIALHDVNGLEADEGLAQRGPVFQETGELLGALHQWNSHLHTTICLKDAPSVVERYPKLEDVAISALGRAFKEGTGPLEVLGGFFVTAASGCTLACNEVVAPRLRRHLAKLEMY